MLLYKKLFLMTFGTTLVIYYYFTGRGRHYSLLQSALVLWTISLNVKRSGHVATLSFTSRAEIKNAWYYTSIPPHTLMARCFWAIPKLACTILIGLVSRCWVHLAVPVGMALANSSHVTSYTLVFSSWTWHGAAKFISVTIRSNIAVLRTR